jgi:hypothetical protein
MWLIDQLVEARISDAQARGEFDNLPGAGKAIKLQDEVLVPEELRTGYRLLKNAGYLPPVVQMRREIAEVEQLLQLAEDTTELQSLNRRLRYLLLKLGESARDNRIMREPYYRAKLVTRDSN